MSSRAAHVIGTPVIEVVAPGRRPYRVLVDRYLEVGRQCDGILLADPMASRVHARIWPDGERLFVEDLGSRNGTLHNGVRVTAPVELKPGDQVRIGSTDLRAAPSMVPLAEARPSTESGLAGRETMVRSGGGGSPSAGSAGEVAVSSIDRLAAEVASDKPTLVALNGAALGAEGSTVTLVFSDIESSTTMAESLGDQRWFSLLRAHDDLVRTLVAARQGTVVKSLGDGFMVRFSSARSATLFAVALQQEMARDPRLDGVKVRVGIHTGEAIEVGGDLFGTHVNIAARVAARAVGGQVLVSSVTRSIVTSGGDLEFGPETEAELKGLSGTYGLSELVWRPRADDGTATSVVTPDEPPTAAVALDEPPGDPP